MENRLEIKSKFKKNFLALRLAPGLPTCSQGVMRIDPTKKLAGILTPVFALRSEGDLGVGDTECMRQMVDWCVRHHFSLLQVLPINETGDDNSPYNAISSMALDPTTIAISPELIPELSPSSFSRIATKSLREELRRGPVSYRKVKALKLRLLHRAFSSFLKNDEASRRGGAERAMEFRAFLAANEHWLSDYSLFRVLMELHHHLPVWEDWPSEHRTPERARDWMGSRSDSERRLWDEKMRFFSYVQWIARRQWVALKHHAEKSGVFLMGDIPFGIGRCSVDVWANRHLFDLQWSCGAPPETFFKPDSFTERWGQNWGIPLYRWDRMKENNHSWWRARVRATAEIFHYFRIDHVLGFYRVYAFPWKPEENHHYTNLSHDLAREKAGHLPRFWPEDDSSDEKKRENCLRGEEILRMLFDAAGETGVVAEDLGMVPDYVRPSLLRLGIPGFKIPMFERHHDGSYKDSAQYPPLSVATLATHDHEPITTCWKRWSSSGEGQAERRHLLSWIGWDPHHAPSDLTPPLHAAVCQKLLSCPSWLAIFMITDLFAQAARFNVPGPMSEGNWTERFSIPINEFDLTAEFVQYLRAVEAFLPRKA